MTPRLFVIAFPFIPLFCLGLALAARLFLGRDFSRLALLLNHTLQGVAGAGLIVGFRGAASVQVVPVSPLPYAIEFAFDQTRLYFLVAYLTPLAFSLFRLRRLDTPTLRLLFLFYLGGCSGLIVAGDVFNFFVFYELMIMAAYALIAVHQQFYASVKYMLFSAVSSVLFLAGIIVLYASGSYFGFSFAEKVAAWPTGNFLWLLLFFALAFIVKGAFFPVSAWVATCHSATISLISAFLASFTIFSGIFGLFYLVLQPAIAGGNEAIFGFLRGISLLTLLIQSFFVFLEPDLKRCVAGSTVYTIGLVGLLLSHRLFEAALAQVAVHALYKSLMFYLLDDLEWEGQTLRGRPRVWGAGGLCVLFATGYFPSLVYFVKQPLVAEDGLYRVLSGAAMFLMSAGFLKFRRQAGPGGAPTLLLIGVSAVMALYYLAWPLYRRPQWSGILPEATLLLLVLLMSPGLYQRLNRLSRLDRRWVFPSLNTELFYIIVLFAAAVWTLIAPVT